MNKKLAIKYFNLWSSKDLIGLESIIHKDCTFEDWTINIDSKGEILLYNESFFKKNEIDLKINNLIESNNEVWCYLTINIDDKEIIDVIDILTFYENQIIKIKAFKG